MRLPEPWRTIRNSANNSILFHPRPLRAHCGDRGQVKSLPYQSELRGLPSLGCMAEFHVYGLTAGLTVRTLASPRATWIPAVVNQCA